MLEEFNINTNIKSYITESFYDYKKFKINLRAYLVEHISGNFILNDHDQIAWISKDQFSNYLFAPADIPINEYLIKSDVI